MAENVSTVFGVREYWDHFLDRWADITAVFGPAVMPGPPTLGGLRALAEETPIVLAFVTESDPNLITFAHTPTAYFPRGHPYDNQTYAFYGDSVATSLPLRLTLPGAVDVRNVRVLRDQAAVLAEITGGANHGFATFRDPAAAPCPADQEDLDVCALLPMPSTVAQRAMQLENVSFQDFHTEFLQPAVGTPDEASLAEMFAWWKAVAAPHAGAGAPHSSLQLATAPPAGTPAETVELQNWTRTKVNRTLRKAPTVVPAPADPLTGTVFTDTISEEFRRVREDTQARAEAAAAPKTYTDRFGEAAGDDLRRLVGAASIDDIPEVHKSLGANSRHNDKSILEGAFAARARDATSLGCTMTYPKASVSLIRVFREQEVTTANPELGVGLSPFNVVCAGHPQAAKANNLARDLSVVEAGGMAPSASDVTRYSMNVAKLPLNEYQAHEQLRGYTVVIDVYFGSAHALAVALRDAVSRVSPHMTTGLNHKSGQPNVRREAALRVMYWIHTRMANYFEERLAGGDPGIPAFSELVMTLKLDERNKLPELPTAWLAQVTPSPTTPASRSPGTAPGATAPGAAAGGTSTRRELGTRVANPRPNAGLRQRWDRSGFTAMNQLLANCTDPSLKPKFGEDEACLSWMLKGTCSDGCARKATHKTISTEVVAQANALLDHCGVPASV